MKLKILFLSLFTTLLLSCGGSNVQTVKTTDQDLTSYDSFAYLPNSNVEVEGLEESDDAVNAFIVESINDNMQRVGYTIDRNDPDLLVLVSVQTDREMATTGNQRYASYPYTSGVNRVQQFYNPYYFRGYNTFSSVAGYTKEDHRYTEGTLIINLVDRETKEVVWKGVASENIFNQPTTDAISELVYDIFEEFPERN